MAAIAAGALLLGAAGLWKTVAVDGFVKFPTDVDLHPQYQGTLTTFVDPSTSAPLATPAAVPLQVNRAIVGVPGESTGSRVLVRETFGISFGGQNTEQVHQYVMDRSTSANVADQRAWAFTDANVVDRTGAYWVALPRDATGATSVPMFKDEIGTTFPAKPTDATESIDGLHLVAFDGAGTNVPVTDAYLGALSAMVPLPHSLTFDQLKPSLVAAGVPIDATLSALVRVASQADLATLVQLTGQPIPLQYVDTFSGRTFVEPDTGAVVDVQGVVERISVRPDGQRPPAAARRAPEVHLGPDGRPGGDLAPGAGRQADARVRVPLLADAGQRRRRRRLGERPARPAAAGRDDHPADPRRRRRRPAAGRGHGRRGLVEAVAVSAPSTPLTSSEAVLWMIERDPVLRSTIVAVALLRRPPDVARLRQRLALAVEAFPRLAQWVAPPATVGVPHWVDVPDFDLDQHVTHVRLPAPGSIRQLLDLAAAQAGEAFDPARPLWHLTVVEGLGHGRAAVVMKVHHAVTDGVGGVGLLPVFTDLEPDPAEAPTRGNGKRRRPAGRPSPSTAAQVASLATAAAASVQDVAMHPGAAVTRVPRAARSTAKLLAPATTSLSPVTTGRGLDRRFEVVDVGLEDLAAAGKAVGGTVNDAFLAAVVGGLQRYHLRHGRSVEELRVTMPINLRSAEDRPGGNRFAPARFAVPVSIADPAARMEALGQIARGWRAEPALGLSDVLAGVLSHLPGQVTTSVFGSMLKGIDFVATNVPGSPERRWLAGAEVLRFYGFGPTSGAAVSFALLSHAGTCGIGINADTTAVPDAAVLRECLEEGIAEVVAVGRSRSRANPAGVSRRRRAPNRRRRASSRRSTPASWRPRPRRPRCTSARCCCSTANPS